MASCGKTFTIPWSLRRARASRGKVSKKLSDGSKRGRRRRADYTISFARSARKELERLPAGLVERILERIEALAESPRPADVTKLKGHKGLWRLRVGDDRVVFFIDDAARVVDVSIVRHRREVYRDL